MIEWIEKVMGASQLEKSFHYSQKVSIRDVRALRDQMLKCTKPGRSQTNFGGSFGDYSSVRQS
jgi:hypothetical protein